MISFSIRNLSNLFNNIFEKKFPKNSNITTEEVLKAAMSIKNGKAGGPDGILNEMLKISCIYNTTAYVNLFNKTNIQTF
jgi:hypothetical protein